METHGAAMLRGIIDKVGLKFAQIPINEDTLDNTDFSTLVHDTHNIVSTDVAVEDASLPPSTLMTYRSH